VKRARPIALIAVGLALGLAACGGDDGEEGTVESPGVDETSSSVSETSSGPEGELTTSGVGEASVGDSTGEVEELFGNPDSEQTGPGCELAPDSPGALAWTYQLGDGALNLTFDAASGKLAWYRNTSPSLETTLGDTVGEEFAILRSNWGSSLEPFPIGEPTAKAGLWVVRDSATEELIFDVRGGKVAGIVGGDVAICE
jgi:hypothetical protein